MSKKLDVIAILNKWTREGVCPALIYDDNGHWAVSTSGFQPVPLGDEPIEMRMRSKPCWTRTPMSSGYSIQQLEALLAQATPGPWEVTRESWPDGHEQAGVCHIVDGDCHDCVVMEMGVAPEEDMALIAALRNAAPAMLHDLKLLAAAREQGVLRECAARMDEEAQIAKTRGDKESARFFREQAKLARALAAASPPQET